MNVTDGIRIELDGVPRQIEVYDLGDTIAFWRPSTKRHVSTLKGVYSEEVREIMLSALLGQKLA